MTLWLCGFFLSVVSFSSLRAPQSQGGAAVPPPLLGHISFPNSGAPAAQPSFIRGVLLLHSFEYDDAIAAFREAERLDPSFALAYWGEALSYNQPLWYNENLEKARAVLSRLGPNPPARQAKAPTDREKGYIDAVERLFGTGTKAARDRAYADRMGELSRANPGDDEAAAFYALALLATIPNGQRDVATSLKAGAIASAILKRNPQHPGAAHYTLHAYDDGEHAAMGLEAARLYAKIAPASSHAQHMPSHAFLPLGLWDEASASDEAAWQTSIDLAKQKGLSAAQNDYHALGWLHYEYLQQGRFEAARALVGHVDRALSLAGSPANHSNHVETEIGRGNGPLSLRNERGSMRARFVIESGRWDVMKGQGSFDNVDELLALGLASVKLGDAARAEAALEQLVGRAVRGSGYGQQTARGDHVSRSGRAVPDHARREERGAHGARLGGAARGGDAEADRAAVSGQAGWRVVRRDAAFDGRRRRRRSRVPGRASADTAPRSVDDRSRARGSCGEAACARVEDRARIPGDVETGGSRAA